MNKRVWITAVGTIVASLGMGGSVLAAEASTPAPAYTSAMTATNNGSVELHFAGAERVSQNGKGGLDVFKADGSVWHYRPNVYQVVNGKRRSVLPNYHIVDRDRVELQMKNADPSAAVVVNPRS
jgi:hypothetical protein